MGASFGSGASGSLFGATGSANFLSRSTAACAAVFFVCTLALAYTSNDRPAQATSTSILDRPANAGSAPPASASGAAAIPGPASGVAAPITAPAPVAAPASASASGAGAIPQK